MIRRTLATTLALSLVAWDVTLAALAGSPDTDAEAGHSHDLHSSLHYAASIGASWYEEAPAMFTSSGTVRAAKMPAGTKVFELASRPGSEKTIYLDFTGHTVKGTWWNMVRGRDVYEVPPFSYDDDSTTYTTTENTFIYTVWAAVAEDFSVFDVNVTTVEPGEGVLERSDANDTVYGLRALIGPAPEELLPMTAAGMGFMEVFGTVQASGQITPALIRPFKAPNPNATAVAELASATAATVAHEVGHGLGLNHHGIIDKGATQEYLTTYDAWNPIMGAANTGLTTWSNGDYAGATNASQDDIQLISRHLPLLADDHANTTDGYATHLLNAKTVRGLINDRTDVDVFKFTASGTTTLTVTPATQNPNIDVKMTVYNAAGVRVATVNTAISSTIRNYAAGCGARWSKKLRAGVYYVEVDAVGGKFVKGFYTQESKEQKFNAPGVYSDYGLQGEYSISLRTTVPKKVTVPVTPAPPVTPETPATN